MGNGLATRGGRNWPHNAIYEILTYRVNKEERTTEPMEYSGKTVEAFYDLLDKLSNDSRKAYMKIFMEEYTLVEVGKVLKCSSTTVRKFLNEVYFKRDANGFIVNRLT